MKKLPYLFVVSSLCVRWGTRRMGRVPPTSTMSVCPRVQPNLQVTDLRLMRYCALQFFLFAVYAKARKTARVPISGDDTICFYTLDYKDRCWVAAWGQKLERQREVDLPLLGAAECQAKLQPVFTAKGRGSYTTALYAAETECTVYSTLQDS